MTGNIFVKRTHSLILNSLIIILLFSYSSALYSQSPANFSGIWTQDNVKSDDFYKSFDVKCMITQTLQSITIKQTFFDKSGAEIATRESAFTLDGKETSKEEQGGINKESAKWSADKKVLTTMSTRTVGTDVYGSSASYSLSENGLVLTVQTKDVNPLGQTVKQIFNKKQ
jgi:hypothetical protein